MTANEAAQELARIFQEYAWEDEKARWPKSIYVAITGGVIALC
jgi:hypothetical protein